MDCGKKKGTGEDGIDLPHEGEAGAAVERFTEGGRDLFCVVLFDVELQCHSFVFDLKMYYYYPIFAYVIHRPTPTAGSDRLTANWLICCASSAT